MATNVTPGGRLKSLINLKRMRDFEFAKLCDISASTLSRYINGKQTLSSDVLERAADILDTNVRYLKCESNDPSPQRYLDMHFDEDNEENPRSAFSYKTGGLREYLDTLGVRFVHKLHIGKMVFQLADNLVWYPITDVESEYYLEGLDNVEYIEEIKKRPDESYFENILEYKGKELVLTDTEYDQFMMRLIASTETFLEDKFGLPYSNLPPIPKNEVDVRYNIAYSALGQSEKDPDYIKEDKE